MQQLPFSITESYQLPLLLLIVVLLALSVLFGIKHGRKTFLQRKLALTGVDLIQNAQLLDAVGEDLVIDFLILKPEKITAVTVLQYEGIIFAAENIDEWTQVVKPGSFKFTNPYQNFATQKNAIERALPDATVECKVFFPNATFPKDKPDAVLLMTDLPAKRQYKSADIKNVSATVAESWKILKGQA